MLASQSLRGKLQRLQKPRSLEVRSCYWRSSEFHTAPGVFLVSKELKLQRHDTHSGIIIVGSENMRAGEGLSGAGRNLWNGRWWVHVRFCSTQLRSSLR